MAKGTGTILIIEDEGVATDVTQAILERLGYDVLAARTGAEAINIGRTFDGNIDIGLLDIGLPDMRGDKVYELMREARPNLKVIVCSGYSIDGPVKTILDTSAQGFIQKSFGIADFSAKVKEVLESE